MTSSKKKTHPLKRQAKSHRRNQRSKASFQPHVKRPRFTIPDPSGKFLNWEEFPWANTSRVVIRNFDSECLSSSDLRSISLISYLSNGKYGITYRVRFNGHRAVLKLVPINFVSDPLQSNTSLKMFKAEEKILLNASQEDIGPKILQSGICTVELWDNYKNKFIRTIKIGFVIMEYFDTHLKKIANAAVDILAKRGFNEKIFMQYVLFFRKIDADLLKDVQKSIYTLGIFPKDLHRQNILYDFDSKRAKIVDWGMSTFLKNKKKLPKAIDQLPTPRNPNGSNILESNGHYYTQRFILDVLSDIPRSKLTTQQWKLIQSQSFPFSH